MWALCLRWLQISALKTEQCFHFKIDHTDHPLKKKLEIIQEVSVNHSIIGISLENWEFCLTCTRDSGRLIFKATSSLMKMSG